MGGVALSYKGLLLSSTRAHHCRLLGTSLKSSLLGLLNIFGFFPSSPNSIVSSLFNQKDLYEPCVPWTHLHISKLPSSSSFFPFFFFFEVKSIQLEMNIASFSFASSAANNNNNQKKKKINKKWATFLLSKFDSFCVIDFV